MPHKTYLFIIMYLAMVAVDGMIEMETKGALNKTLYVDDSILISASMEGLKNILSKQEAF